MPEIGTTLRETRMRERIDITEVESATKIRAKYLRALENEEWDLLPGPTFVKTFLRTYAEYLGLDAKLLVEEYKQRFERPGPQDLLPFGPQRSGRRQQRRAYAIPPFVILGLCVVALLGLLYALGTLGNSSNPDEAGLPVTETPTPRPASSTPSAGKKPAKRPKAVPTRVRLQIIPTGTVNVCLVDAGGRMLIPSSNLTAGSSTRVFRAKRLRVTFGNGFAKMRVNGKTVDVPDRNQPVGYELRPGKAPRELAADKRPTCAA
jgi:cytoskeleton protein RodZ